MVGLKDQGKINQIVYKFITNYDALFKEENEISPYNEWVIKDVFAWSIVFKTLNLKDNILNFIWTMCQIPFP